MVAEKQPRSEPVLELRGVVKQYGTGVGAVRALRGVTFALRPGTLTIVAGPSGSGKSTLLSAAGCLLRPDSGSVTIMGREVGGYDETQAAEIRRKYFGFIFQGVHLLPALTAGENVGLALELKGTREAEIPRRTTDLLALTGVAELAERLPKDMSGGQRQRVAISRALAGRPTILLADEPTAALDRTNARAVLSLLRQLTQRMGLAVLVVTHDRSLFGYADRLLTLNDGRIVRSAVVVRKPVRAAAGEAKPAFVGTSGRTPARV